MPIFLAYFILKKGKLIMAKKKILVQGINITIDEINKEEFVCITDIAKQVETGLASIENWMRSRNTVEYLGTWERLYNENFNSVGFDGITKKVGLNTFKLSTKKWVEETNAIGMQARAGRYGGTYAHKDIALNYCYWLSPSFQLYFIREFQRLKEVEAEQLGSDWSVKRLMSKANHAIHTEAIKENLIPKKLQSSKVSAKYFSSEVDLINIALFGMTAKEWRQANPKLEGNIRDHANADQLLVLSNLQSLNAKLMEWDCDQEQRLQIMNETAIKQMEILIKNKAAKTLGGVNTLKIDGK